MPHVDPDHVAGLIRQVAETVILPRFRALGENDIREKKPGDLVTVADVESEAALSRHLVDLLPGSTVVGEEGVAADPAVVDKLSEAAPVWVIDPIDGTRNFAHGRPRFAVMVALVQGGETVQSWIYDPLGGRMAIAELGGGSWLWGRRMTIAPERPLSRQAGTVGWRHSPTFGEAVAKVVRYGCAGHDYLALLTDQLQFAFYRKLNPWDHAPGELLFREAGGYVRLTDGEPYRPVPLTGAMVLAPGVATWEKLRILLARKSI